MTRPLSKWHAGWARLRPEAVTVSPGERLRSALAALLGVLFTALICTYFAGGAPLMVAAVGASAVLLFALPTSPLAQPWSVIGSYLVSGFVGVTCARFVPIQALSAALAVSAAVLCMMWLRCVHPPGGAVALSAVIGGDAIHGLGYQYLLAPVLINGALLVLSALIVNNLLPGRHYPRHAPDDSARPENGAAVQDPFPVVHGDVAAALAEYDHLLDVSGEDLDQVIALAEKHAFRRSFGEMNCAAVMARDSPSVRADAPTRTAWKVLRRHRLPAIAVVDAGHRLVGLVGVNDFIDRAGARGPSDLRRRLARFITHNMARESTVAAVMVPPVVTARTDMHIAELIPYFRSGLALPIPVVDEGRRYVGMISTAVLVAALFRKHMEHAPAAA
jgi:CBS domain-containing membrane protein